MAQQGNQQKGKQPVSARVDDSDSDFENTDTTTSKRNVSKVIILFFLLILAASLA